MTLGGRKLHLDIEAATDLAASSPWHHLGPERTARLAELMEPWIAAIVGSGTIRFPNPMNLPAPT